MSACQKCVLSSCTSVLWRLHPPMGRCSPFLFILLLVVTLVVYCVNICIIVFHNYSTIISIFEYPLYVRMLVTINTWIQMFFVLCVFVFLFPSDNCLSVTLSNSWSSSTMKSTRPTTPHGPQRTSKWKWGTGRHWQKCPRYSRMAARWWRRRATYVSFMTWHFGAFVEHPVVVGLCFSL